MLLGVPEFYTLEKVLKRMNRKALWLYFPKIIFQDFEDENVKKNLILFGSSRLMPTSLFDNYYY